MKAWISERRIAIRIERRDIRMQFARIGRRGGGEDDLRPAGLLHGTILQHDELVGPFRGDRQIMRDQKKADVEIVLQTRQQVEDALLYRDIESGCRLVRHQKRGRGSTASPISTRCSMPPESWWG